MAVVAAGEVAVGATTAAVGGTEVGAAAAAAECCVGGTTAPPPVMRPLMASATTATSGGTRSQSAGTRPLGGETPRVLRGSKGSRGGVGAVGIKIKAPTRMAAAAVEAVVVVAGSRALCGGLRACTGCGGRTASSP